MAIELTWLIPDKILLSRWSGDVGDEDIRVLVGELRIILDAALAPIHTVIDMSEVKHIASNVFYLYVQSDIPLHSRRGRIGMVRPTVEGEILADLINRFTQHEMIRLFPSRDEARNYLLEHDTTPPILQFGSDLVNPQACSLGPTPSA